VASIEREGFTLLLGEPGPDRGLTEKMLVQGGLAVATGTVAEVLDMPDLTPPLITILDDAGSHQDRIGVLQSLLAHPPLQGVPVLILARDTDIDSYTTAITKGAAAYLTKPVYEDELLEVVQRLSGWSGHSDRTERRRRLRRPVVMRVSLDIRKDKRQIPGTLVDVSSGGCRVEIAEPLAAGDLVRVVLNAHEETTHVALGGEIRWHTQTPQGAHLVGVKFTGTTAMLAGKILGFVSSGLT
jgi:CheY-like chemotaxis protein